MKFCRRMVLAGLASGAILIALAGWWLTRRDDFKLATAPARPPELYGVVQKSRTVQDSVRSYEQFLIRCLQPPAGVPDSPQNQWQRSINLDVWIWIFDATRVIDRGGAALPRIAVGKTVSAWCSGTQLTTDPPQWAAEVVVIEANSK